MKVFTANGCPKRLTEHTLRHHTTRNQPTQPTQQDTTSESNKKLLFPPYIRGVSEKIERICFPHDVKVISKSQDTLRQSLMKVKATRPEEKRRGVVYEVPCRDCNSVYVRETGWSLEIRLKEHKYAVKMGDTKNSIVVHAWTNEHQVDWDAAKVKVCEQLTRRKVMESSLSMHTPAT